MVAGIFDEVL